MSGTLHGNGSVLEQALARQIRLLGLDVDGVLTDNAVFLGEVGGERVEFKRFDIQDGLGIAMLRDTEIEVALISGRTSAATVLRGTELKIGSILQVRGPAKVPAIEELLAARGLTWDQMAFVGDDLADIPVLERVALPIAVANAREEVKALCRWVTGAEGGMGAVREVIETLLKARGEWDAAVAAYLGRDVAAT